MNFIKHKCKKHFIIALKSNRLVSLSKKDLLAGKSQIIDSLKTIENYPVRCWIPGVDFPVLIYSQVFNCDSDKLKTIYKKR
jgi:hypothetical protein